MILRSSKTFLSIVSVAMAVVLIQPATAQTVQIPDRLSWLRSAQDPSAVMAAVTEHGAKLPPEFAERLKFVFEDNTLRVIVTMTSRDDTVESFVKSNTTWLSWYGTRPRFLARVTPDQLGLLLEAPQITFVEPDYKITNFMSTSTLDVHARSLNEGTGVWSFDPAGGPRGALRSEVPGLSVDQATGKGVTVAITDSGIDKTFRDFGGWECTAPAYGICGSRILKALSTEHIAGPGADPSDDLPTTDLASGHGTHIAGTVAGNAYYTRFRSPDPARYGADGHNFGIAPQANLISLKNGDTIWAGLSQYGLEWILDNHEEYGIRVSSNSWGCLTGCSFSPSSATAQVSRDLYNAGVVVTFAAGNGGGGPNGAAFSGNAQSPYVLGVANYDDAPASNPLYSSSSRGVGSTTLPDPATWTPESEGPDGVRRPDVAAPGTSIWSAGSLTGGAASAIPRASVDDGAPVGATVPYRSMTGTSMSTPHVSGAAALLFAACPEADALDVMRAIMASADPKDVSSTDGTRRALPYEAGHGALEIRTAVDWLMARNCDTGGGGTDPDPTTETPCPTTTVAESTRYYFHSAGGSGNVDAADDSTTFDSTAPTAEGAEFFDAPFQNSTYNDLFDPYWLGTVDQPIDELTVDFWARVPVGRALSSIDYDVSLWVEGETAWKEHAFPRITVRGDATISDGYVRVRRTFTEANAGAVLPIDPTGRGVSLSIGEGYVVDGAASSIAYDEPELWPSGFTVTTCSTQEAAATTTELTAASASRGQFSDEVVFEARVSDPSQEGIANEEVVFELAGDDGTRAFTAITDADGIARQTVRLTEDPGSYALAARYAGVDGVFTSSEDVASFVIDKEDSDTRLVASGTAPNRIFTVTVTDADDAASTLEGITIRFFEDGVLIGTATTDADGVARYITKTKKKSHYEAVAVGDDRYGQSSASYREK